MYIIQGDPVFFPIEISMFHFCGKKKDERNLAIESSTENFKNIKNYFTLIISSIFFKNYIYIINLSSKL